VFYFHSDSSVNDWGYGATITATFDNSLPFSSPPFAFALTQELLNLFDEVPPVVREYEIPASVFGPCEGRESKCEGVQDRLSQLFLGLSSFEALPDSISKLFDYLGDCQHELKTLDVAAIVVTPARFVPLRPISPSDSVVHVLELLAEARKPIHDGLERLAQRTST
jgi:hypothetical protein